MKDKYDVYDTETRKIKFRGFYFDELCLWFRCSKSVIQSSIDKGTLIENRYRVHPHGEMEC